MSQDQPGSELGRVESLEGRSGLVPDGALEQGQGEQGEGLEHEPLHSRTKDDRVAPNCIPPTRRMPPEQDEILPQTLLRLLGEAIVVAQPLLKQQGIKALKGTIRLLEKTVVQLEAAPAPKHPKQAKGQESKRKQGKGTAPAPETASENALPPPSQRRTGKLVPAFSTGALWEKFQSLWRQLWRSWRSILRQIRDRLPASINRQWSDQALTGAIVGVLAIVLWATSAVLPDRSPPTTVAKAPPVTTVAPSPTPTPAPVPSPMPPIVTAPKDPKLVEISPAPVKPSPPPPLKLTPEQALIVRIQDQVAAISNQYANGLVESVQANFRSSRLIVHISDGWYGLGRSQQEKLAGELLSRTQTLAFSKLEIVDTAGTLLARSPVVGSEMVILKRTTDAVPPA